VNESFDEAQQRPGRRAAGGITPTVDSLIPEFVVPAAPADVPAPPRRGNRVTPGYEVQPAYVAEVLAMPATVPAAGIPPVEETVDFDRMIADEAPADFEELAAREADEAFRTALLPAVPGAGGLNDFAVYGDPDPIRPETTFPKQFKQEPPAQAPAPEAPAEAPNPLIAAAAGSLTDFAVYGDPDTAPAASQAPDAKPVDPSRDVGVTEKPNFYNDPTGDDVTHTIRFTPGKTLSMGHRRVYRADSRGIPIFSPGWTAKMAAAHYQRSFIIRASLAFVIVGICAAMAFLAVGADSNYLSVKEHGVAVDATVATVATDVKKDDAAANTDLGATTTATAAVQFQIDGKTYTRNLLDTSKSATAMLGADTAWQAGQKVRIYADLDHSGQILAEDTSQPGRLNAVTLSPLIFAALFALAAVFAWTNASKMKQIDEVEG
jgi:hypothetical protein